MAIVCLIAAVAPHMTTKADWIALWLIASGSFSVPAGMLWRVGLDAIKPVEDD
jgi:hypothetical protein